ncbi:MAG: hypothetical protein IKP68_04950 [Clostridia bacterium]|nr:hypothetical protein [Clostridia bacterium]
MITFAPSIPSSVSSGTFMEKLPETLVGFGRQIRRPVRSLLRCVVVLA